MILAVMNAIYAIAYIEAKKLKTSAGFETVTGSNLVEVLNFSGFYIRNYINCVHNCEDHSLLDFTSAVQYMKY